MAQHIIRLRTGLQNLPCAVSSFAAVAIPPMVRVKLSGQALSQILNGQRDFDSLEDAEDFIRVLETMEFLQENIRPQLRIDWSDALMNKDALIATFEERRNGEDPIVVRLWYIRLSRLNFLKRMREKEPIATINYQIDGAAFENTNLADKAVRKLKQLGVPSQLELLTAPRRRSTITRSLEEIGFAPEEQDDGAN